MTTSSRAILLLLILALGLNHFILGLLWIDGYQNTQSVYVAFGLYALGLIASLFSTTKLRLPLPVAIFSLVIAFAIPPMVLSQLPFGSYAANGSYATWFIAAVSLVLAVTSARGYPWVGWVGTASLWIEVIEWGGFQAIVNTGLIGALVMVLTAHAVGRGLRSTSLAAQEYYRQAAELQAKAARSSVGRETRQQITQTVMFTALPLLERIRDQSGKLADSDRDEAILLEARFRDEIQGANLLNDGVRLATREARKRGVEVSFNDGGGLAGLSSSELAGLHNSIIQALSTTLSGKIHISAPTGKPYRVAITAQRPEASGPDLWLRLS